MEKYEIMKSFLEGSKIEQIDTSIANSKWEYITIPTWNWERYVYRLKVDTKIHLEDFDYNFFLPYDGIRTNIGYLKELNDFDNINVTTLEESVFYSWYREDTLPVRCPIPLDIQVKVTYRNNHREVSKASAIFENFRYEMNDSDIISFQILKQSIYI